MAVQMMAHYVNVLEDTGPNTFDELPRPLRNLSFNDDFFTPFCNMTISLAFLAPDLVKAAIDGRLPHGMGVARLADLSAEWSRQRQMLGLPVL